MLKGGLVLARNALVIGGATLLPSGMTRQAAKISFTGEDSKIPFFRGGGNGRQPDKIAPTAPDNKDTISHA